MTSSLDDVSESWRTRPFPSWYQSLLVL